MDFAFTLLRQTRQNMANLVKGLTVEQIQQVPHGFSNHILWNATHALVTQQLLTYGQSGLPFRIDQTLIDQYRKGTRPGPALDSLLVNQLAELLVESPEWLEEDYHEGLFEAYTHYPTTYGVELRSIEDAIQFNTVHEGLHLGYMMGIRKAL